MGIRSLAYELDETVSENELLNLVGELNEREDVDGILVQLPLPAHINEDLIIREIDPLKAVSYTHLDVYKRQGWICGCAYGGNYDDAGTP